jgi:hypothetical protein
MDEKQRGKALFRLYDKPGENPWVTLEIQLPIGLEARAFHSLTSRPASYSEYSLLNPSKELLIEIVEEASRAHLALTRAEFKREKLAKEEPEGVMNGTVFQEVGAFQYDGNRVPIIDATDAKPD